MAYMKHSTGRRLDSFAVRPLLSERDVRNNSGGYLPSAVGTMARGLLPRPSPAHASSRQ